mmetsp:Transcript_9362/g.15078  ORF Transcript_9362/g.15078 Transcript_9362/m.15078 type:complete len:632 (+) Transcript_9362:40-1935(+)|eukprot:CAMPEP_0169188388 /NCGR_PEP_ID=MMETSP1016-20121227/3436_1 /TAXON_ID=342587 /ORGANISM="Karlodinium micrum, Strain CCMP2283" /LENGTH=631 /DNA_ID=CAMNT_0009264421 /DNA_START=38 /DNA_END=1933 /DNA_ORIENTATION=-
MKTPPQLPKPSLSLRLECVELDANFAMLLTSSADRIPYHRILQALASVGIFGSGYDLGNEEQLQRFESTLQQQENVRKERHQFYKEMEKTSESMTKTMQAMKRDYYREIDHLREQLSRKSRDPDFEPENVVFFDVGAYNLPSWDDVANKLDGMRMQRELLLKELGGKDNVKHVPMHMMCSQCRNKFKDLEAKGLDLCCHRSVQTKPSEFSNDAVVQTDDDTLPLRNLMEVSPSDCADPIAEETSPQLSRGVKVSEVSEHVNDSKQGRSADCGDSSLSSPSGRLRRSEDRRLRNGASTDWNDGSLDIDTIRADDNSNARQGWFLSAEEKAERLKAVLLKTFGDGASYCKKVGICKLIANWSQRQKDSIRKHHMRHLLGRNPEAEVDQSPPSSSLHGTGKSRPDALCLDSLPSSDADLVETCATERLAIEKVEEIEDELPRPATSGDLTMERPFSSSGSFKKLEIGLPSPTGLAGSFGRSFGKRVSPYDGFSQVPSMVNASRGGETLSPDRRKRGLGLSASAGSLSLLSKGSEILSPEGRPSSKRGLSLSASAGNLSLLRADTLSPDLRPASKHGLNFSAPAGSWSLPNIDLWPKSKNSPSKPFSRKERHFPEADRSISQCVVGSACKFTSPN